MEFIADLEERQSPGLAEIYAEKMTLQKENFARKNKPDKKARTKPAKTFAEKCSRFQKLDFIKKNTSYKKRILPNETACLPKPKLKTLKPILET